MARAIFGTKDELIHIDCHMIKIVQVLQLCIQYHNS